MFEERNSEEIEKGLKSLSIQELERNRISSDLHDTVVQNLTGLILKSELCSRLVDIDPTRAKLEIASMVDLLKSTIFDLRETIFDLRPPSLSDFGLVQAIEDYCENINSLHNTVFTFSYDGEQKRLCNEVEINLYRIAQEACNNTVKHAHALHADIHVSFQSENVVLKISDDGIGIKDFKISDNAFRKNFGTKIMEERTELLKGHFEMISEDHKGTTIIVSVPYIFDYE